MTEKKKIFNFAVKWARKFRNPRTTSNEIVCSMEMSDDCFALGFEMDQGHSFIRRYGRAWRKPSELKKIINEIEDISILGSAIHSKWRYFNHWADYTEDILDTENREWFLLALGRLAVLAQGKVKKLRLVSNNTCFCSVLDDMGKEIEQHITMNSDGMVWFSAYNLQLGASYKKGRSKSWKIKKDSAIMVLEKISMLFASEYNEMFVLDIGSWTLELTNTEGIVFKYKGSLICIPKIEKQNLSGLIREVLGMDDLFVFDGKARDRVERVSVDYSRMTKAEPRSRKTKTYTEKLVIDRESGTLEYIQQSDDSQISRKYRVGEKIEAILDDLDEDELFGEVEGNPKDVVKDPLESKNYTITVDFKDGPQKVISGTFDKRALPDNWEDFAKKVKDLIKLYGSGDLLNPALYDKVKRRAQEYVYCSVVFEGSYKRYYYIASDDINVGDYVLVPVGSDNRSSIAEVVKIENFEVARVPLPLEKTKHVIRKCTKEDFTYF